MHMGVLLTVLRRTHACMCYTSMCYMCMWSRSKRCNPRVCVVVATRCPSAVYGAGMVAAIHRAQLRQ